MINTGNGRYILFVGDIMGDKFFVMGDISTVTDRVNNRVNDRVNVHLAENKVFSKGFIGKSTYRCVQAFSSTLLRRHAWWLDRWLDESGWCAQPPEISMLSERAYDFGPRTLHHETISQTSDLRNNGSETCRLFKVHNENYPWCYNML